MVNGGAGSYGNNRALQAHEGVGAQLQHVGAMGLDRHAFLRPRHTVGEAVFGREDLRDRGRREFLQERVRLRVHLHGGARPSQYRESLTLHTNHELIRNLHINKPRNNTE